MPVNTNIHVFENRPRWVPELKRQFLNEPITVRLRSSVQEITRQADQSQQSLLVLALHENPNAILNLLKFRMMSGLQSQVIVVADEQWMTLEWSLRESGILAFASDRISGSELAKLCRRAISE